MTLLFRTSRPNRFGSPFILISVCSLGTYSRLFLSNEKRHENCKFYRAVVSLTFHKIDHEPGSCCDEMQSLDLFVFFIAILRIPVRWIFWRFELSLRPPMKTEAQNNSCVWMIQDSWIVHCPTHTGRFYLRFLINRNISLAWFFPVYSPHFQVFLINAGKPSLSIF